MDLNLVSQMLSFFIGIVFMMFLNRQKQYRFFNALSEQTLINIMKDLEKFKEQNDQKRS